MALIPVYEELALKIEPDPVASGFRVRVLQSPRGGSPSEALKLPCAIERIPEILRSLEAMIRSPPGSYEPKARDVKPPRDQHPGMTLDVKALGQDLFRGLFSGSVRENLLESLALIEGLDRVGLRIRLVFDAERAGPVSALPWELLCRYETRDFLSRQILTPVVRDLDVQRPRLTPRSIEKLRVLIVLTKPVGQTILDVEEEKRHICDALGGEARVKLQFLEQPTIDGLRAKIRQNAYDVLHFVGHGGFRDMHEGFLFFEDENRQSATVTGTVLADTLKGLSKIRLVFINACDTAQMPRSEDGSDPYQGVASALVMSGIPAVIAMQFPITDAAAILFSKGFYHALAGGDPVESAVTEGRLAVFRARPDLWEWATPVLFLGAPVGSLFEIDEARETEELRSDFDSDLSKALELLDSERYEGAVELLKKLQTSADDDYRIRYYLALSRLAGKRPRSHRLGVVKQVEEELDMAGFLAGVEEPPHVTYLRALIKFDFYRLKGLRISPPSVEELMLEARAANGDSRELQRLLTLVPTPPSEVRRAIEDHRRASIAR